MSHFRFCSPFQPSFDHPALNMISTLPKKRRVTVSGDAPNSLRHGGNASSGAASGSNLPPLIPLPLRGLNETAPAETITQLQQAYQLKMQQKALILARRTGRNNHLAENDGTLQSIPLNTTFATPAPPSTIPLLRQLPSSHNSKLPHRPSDPTTALTSPVSISPWDNSDREGRAAETRQARSVTSTSTMPPRDAEGEVDVEEEDGSSPSRSQGSISSPAGRISNRTMRERPRKMRHLAATEETAQGAGIAGPSSTTMEAALDIEMEAELDDDDAAGSPAPVSHHRLSSSHPYSSHSHSRAHSRAPPNHSSGAGRRRTQSNIFPTSSSLDVGAGGIGPLRNLSHLPSASSSPGRGVSGRVHASTHSHIPHYPPGFSTASSSRNKERPTVRTSSIPSGTGPRTSGAIPSIAEMERSLDRRQTQYQSLTTGGLDVYAGVPRPSSPSGHQESSGDYLAPRSAYTDRENGLGSASTITASRPRDWAGATQSPTTATLPPNSAYPLDSSDPRTSISYSYSQVHRPHRRDDERQSLPSLHSLHAEVDLASVRSGASSRRTSFVSREGGDSHRLPHSFDQQPAPSQRAPFVTSDAPTTPLTTLAASASMSSTPAHRQLQHHRSSQGTSHFGERMHGSASNVLPPLLPTPLSPSSPQRPPQIISTSYQHNMPPIENIISRGRFVSLFEGMYDSMVDARRVSAWIEEQQSLTTGQGANGRDDRGPSTSPPIHVGSVNDPEGAIGSGGYVRIQDVQSLIDSRVDAVRVEARRELDGLAGRIRELERRLAASAGELTGQQEGSVAGEANTNGDALRAQSQTPVPPSHPSPQAPNPESASISPTSPRRQSTSSATPPQTDVAARSAPSISSKDVVEMELDQPIPSSP